MSSSTSNGQAHPGQTAAAVTRDCVKLTATYDGLASITMCIESYMHTLYLHIYREDPSDPVVQWTVRNTLSQLECLLSKLKHKILAEVAAALSELIPEAHSTCEDARVFLARVEKTAARQAAHG